MSDEDDKPVTRSFLLNTLSKLFNIANSLPVIKQFQEEEMRAIEPLYCSVGEVDGHGDFIPTIEEMRDFVNEINKKNDRGELQSSISHIHKTNSFKMIRAWVNECDCIIGDVTVPKGMPLAEMQFTNKAAWDMRKVGKLLGLSIGALAKVTPTEDGKNALTKLSFDFRGAHLAYTDVSVGGAASGYNSPIILKSNMFTATPEQLAIIKELEEELTPLDKTLGVSNADNGKQNTPSTSANAEAVMAGDDKKVLEGKEKTMSEQDLIAANAAQAEVVKKLEEQVAALMLANAKEKAKNSIAKYKLEESEAEGLAQALAVLPEDAKESVVKALDSLVSKLAEKEVEIAKAKETASPQEEIVKAAQKELSAEVGHDSQAALPSIVTDAEAKAEAIAKAYEQLAQLEKSKGAK
jgi:hypothetical protein